jgi:hypothetical protein
MQNDSSTSEASWDLFRLSKSKQIVDVASNTLRKYNREGLRFYRNGKAVFISKIELAEFIRTHAEKPETRA